METQRKQLIQKTGRINRKLVQVPVAIFPLLEQNIELHYLNNLKVMLDK